MIKVILMVILALTMTSCARVTEPDDLAYVVAIGIDADGDTKKFTLQIANPLKISGGSNESGGEDGKETISNITVSGENVYQAVNTANHLYSKELSLAHTKLILISDKIAEEEGLKDFAEFLARSEEIRPNTFLSIVKGDAREYLSEVKPTNEVNPVKYYETIFDSDYTSFIPKSTVKDFYCYSMSSERETCLPLSAVKEEKTKGTLKTENHGFEEGTKDFKAGEIDSQGDIKTETAGMAILRDTKLVATASSKEAELYNIITGSYLKSETSYFDKNSPGDTVSVMQSQGEKPKIKVDISGDVPKIYVHLSLEADLRTTKEDYLLENNIGEFENQASEQIKNAALDFLYKTSRDYKSDIVGFGRYVKRNFKSFDEFEEYDWSKRYEDAEFYIDVDFKLRRSGLVNRKRG